MRTCVHHASKCLQPHQWELILKEYRQALNASNAMEKSSCAIATLTKNSAFHFQEFILEVNFEKENILFVINRDFAFFLTIARIDF